ncbi:MAG TPA: hypothetical protein PLH94_12395 [Fimbriimonadaceae bacterium]|nr:hypothetical protein [Fimbriimonadaceae bacterium]
MTSAMQWEFLGEIHPSRGFLFRAWRAAVPGGWLIVTDHFAGMSFYPDPEHVWDGGSLEIPNPARSESTPV